MKKKQDCFLERLHQNAPGPILFLGKGISNLSIEKILLRFNLKHKKDFFFFSKIPHESDFSDLETGIQKSKARSLVVSPGFPMANPLIQHFKNQNGNSVTSELNIASLALDQENCIGITGSLGKSTTTALLGECLKIEDPQAFVGGNLGIPLGQYAFEILFEKRPPARWVVLELSSFQLENCNQLVLSQAGLTFLSANHLERYDNLQHYYDTKFQILNLLNPTGFLHVNTHGGDAQSEVSKRQLNKTLLADFRNPKIQKFLPQYPKLLGQHNLQNMAVVVSILNAIGVTEKCSKQLGEFKGLEHRMEFVGENRGVQWINDSKATALDSVECAVKGALEGLQKSSKLWVLLGGRDKKHPWADLLALKNNSQLRFVFFGEARNEIKRALQIDEENEFPEMKKALEWVSNQTQSGDRVLLSPGGTSLDEFKNFGERGQVFKEFFKNL